MAFEIRIGFKQIFTHLLSFLIEIQKEKPDTNIMDELAEFHGISKFEMERRIKEVIYV